MASDDTRPKVRMLLTIGVVAVFLLLGMKFVLDSYYLDMVETYEHGLLPKPELRDKTKQEQLGDIDKGQNGAIPVSVAMQTLAQKGRDNASPDITAEQSDDVDPLKGWTKLKRELHLPPQMGSAAAPPPPPEMAADAGAPTMMTPGDAGAHAMAPPAGDGGVRVHLPPPPRAPQNPKDGGK